MTKWKRSATFDKTCQRCGTDFISKSPISKFCCAECRIENIVLQKSKDTGDEYVTCMLCNRAVFNVTGNHLSKYHPEYTSEMYRKEFPDSPVESRSTWERKREGSIKAGARMREPEMKKLFSELLKGENNPMHRSKTTDEERRAISPFSPDFYLKRDPSLALDEAQKLAQDKTKEATDKIVSWTQIEYWTREGHTEEEAKAIISEKQKTFSLEICIEKYGEEAGRKRWEERQEKWKSKVFNDETFIGGGHSMIATEMINGVLISLQEKGYNGEIFHGERERFINNGKGNVFKYDLTFQDERKIIEFNGDFWHCNPELFEPDFWSKPKKMTAQEIWDYDVKKKQAAEEQGYELLYIWERDYRNNKQATIDRCIDFIYASNPENTEEAHSSTHQHN
jgi:G:T-mismatch repair DNA endonuclease (very short patch repair protein)